MARRQRNAVASSIGVYRDHQARTCLLVEDGEQVKFIPLDISDGFHVHETTKASFDQRYKLMPEYPMDKAAQLYLNYCLAVGATDEVIDQLSQFISITDEDRKVATSKRAAAPAKPAKKEVVEKPARKRRVKKTETAPVEKPARKRRVKSTSTEYTSAAQMFQGLIMEGKLTDDEIFSQVQEAFGLDDKKRSYVTWYRNNLTKKGMNPPVAK